MRPRVVPRVWLREAASFLGWRWDRMGLARVVVVAQGKGGVGKTSLTANVAGLAALAGHRVLAVDLDQQGNLARDLGYEPGDGERLLQAVVAGQPVPVVPNVRPGLDVVPGGPATGDLLVLLSPGPVAAAGIWPTC